MAASLIKINVGSDLTFKSSGGSATWTPTSVALGSGRLSNVLDLGAAPRARLYRWRCQMKWVATPTANDAFRVYLATSNALATAAATDGGTTFGDATVTSETVAAAQYLYLGAVIAATATDQAWCASGTVEILDRYVAGFGFNAAVAKALSGTAGDFTLVLTPIYDEIEAAA